MYHYPTVSPGYGPYVYNTSPSSSEETHEYYPPPQYATPRASARTSSRRHPRRESFSSPQGPPQWQSPAGYPSQEYYATMPSYDFPPARYDNYVSTPERPKSKSRRFWAPGTSGGGNNGSPRRHASKRSQGQRIFIDVVDEAEDSPPYRYHPPRPAHYQHKYAKADSHFYFNQVPVYAEPSDSQPARSRARRPSQSTADGTPSRPAKPAAAKPPPQATAEDAAKAGIPAGYSIKNWDPTEAAVLLLGSVFDANSLGKWIYDWTVYHHGPATPMSEVAGDLWLLLIKLAGKMKRAEECLPRIRAIGNQEMVEDFLESGDRLWDRLKRLLKVCEEFMWRVARRDGEKGGVKMGKNSGCEFVETIFGRDRELEKTEKLMASIRLWNMRFDANCEDILKRPSAV